MFNVHLATLQLLLLADKGLIEEFENNAMNYYALQDPETIDFDTLELSNAFIWSNTKYGRETWASTFDTANILIQEHHREIGGSCLMQ
jgi:hypothetical protein